MHCFWSSGIPAFRLSSSPPSLKSWYESTALSFRQIHACWASGVNNQAISQAVKASMLHLLALLACEVIMQARLSWSDPQVLACLGSRDRRCENFGLIRKGRKLYQLYRPILALIPTRPRAHPRFQPDLDARRTPPRPTFRLLRILQTRDCELTTNYIYYLLYLLHLGDEGNNLIYPDHRKVVRL